MNESAPQHVGKQTEEGCVNAVASGAGLLFSYHFSLPSGPAIILAAGGLHVLSLLFGPAGGVVPASRLRRHRAA